MRTLCWWSLVGAAALALVGCSSTSPTSPTGQADLNDLYDAMAPTQGGSVENASGHYRVHIDVASLTGYAVDVNRARAGAAAAQGDLSFLGVNAFFTAGPVFELVSLGLDASIPPNVVMTYSCTHPFGAPVDFTGPSNALKRDDLGATGRMVFLVDTPVGGGDDYDYDLDGTAGAETHLNPLVVKNADGYYNPGGMADTATFGTHLATHFPYKLLVDESLDPRTDSAGVAIPNNIGTVPTGAGNYSATDGWQQGNAGVGRNGWTGYGEFHQGQTSTNSVVFDPDAAVGGSFDLDLVLCVKYVQPKGPLLPSGEKPRLPQNPVSTTEFCYLMPYGALDLEKVSVTAPASVSAVAASTATATLDVVDQDFAATVGTFPATITNIPFASGIATITLASTELGAQAAVTVSATGTGAIDAPATQTMDVTNALGTTGGSDNGAWVVVEVADQATVAGNETSFTLVGNPPAPVAVGTERTARVLQAFFVPIV